MVTNHRNTKGFLRHRLTRDEQEEKFWKVKERKTEELGQIVIALFGTLEGWVMIIFIALLFWANWSR